MSGRLKNLFVLLCAAMTLAVAGLMGAAAHAGVPKYVFFFLGDGMSTAQVNAAEVYLASKEEPLLPEGTRLSFTLFPVQGLCTTWDQFSFVTDSASAGTAFACGHKTKNGVICMDHTGTIPYTSVAKKAKEAGMKVGIVSSVSIDHATPAAYYANQKSRNDYYDISMQLAESDFDYFGGGGPIIPTGKNGDQPSSIEAAQANGFHIVNSRTAFDALQAGQYEKVWAYEPVLDSGSALYYELDRLPGMITLEEFTRKGIGLLNNPNGFFMMVEGGKIDWACHANDGRAAIDDVLAFDAAVQAAIEFYEQHPTETLIVVTGDHDCGGMSIGFAGTQYKTFYHILERQTQSYIEFDKVLTSYKAQGDDPSHLIAAVTAAYGLEFLSPEQKDALKTACDGGDQHACTTLKLALEDWEIQSLVQAYWMSMTPKNLRPTDPQTYLLYGGYEPLTMALTHVLNHKAGIGWTSYAHTGVPVPVFSAGACADSFGGFYDNTDIYTKLLTCMGIH